MNPSGRKPSIAAGRLIPSKMDQKGTVSPFDPAGFLGQGSKAANAVRASYARAGMHDPQALRLRNRTMRRYASNQGWAVVVAGRGAGSIAAQLEFRENLLEAGPQRKCSARKFSAVSTSLRRRSQRCNKEVQLLPHPRHRIFAPAERGRFMSSPTLSSFLTPLQRRTETNSLFTIERELALSSITILFRPHCALTSPSPNRPKPVAAEAACEYFRESDFRIWDVNP
jgi:hypothetical protein